MRLQELDRWQQIKVEAPWFNPEKDYAVVLEDEDGNLFDCVGVCKFHKDTDEILRVGLLHGGRRMSYVIEY